MVSVNVFGEYGLMYEYTDFSALRVGDFIEYYTGANNHVVTIIEINKERGYARFVDGNNSGQVSWGYIIMPKWDGDNPLTSEEMKNPYNNNKSGIPVQIKYTYKIYSRYQTPPNTTNYTIHDLNDYDEDGQMNNIY